VRKQGGGKSRDITGLCDLGKGARATVPGGLGEHYRRRQRQKVEKGKGKKNCYEEEYQFRRRRKLEVAWTAKMGRIGRDCGVGRAFAKRPTAEEGW
jgi:hypothetical protein